MIYVREDTLGGMCVWWGRLDHKFAMSISASGVSLVHRPAFFAFVLLLSFIFKDRRIERWRGYG